MLPKLERVVGNDPTAYCLEGNRSNQLSYTREMKMAPESPLG